MKICLLGAILLLSLPSMAVPASTADSPAPVSEEAAQAFLDKVKEIETFASEPQQEEEKTTRFTEEEINSYLNLYGDTKYRSCLQYFRISFRQEFLVGTASVDFDCLQESSPGSGSRLLTGIFSGIHTLTARGTIENDKGKGNFLLQEARFDSVPLPGFLVEQLISGICMRLEPPFDPLEPSPFPLKIRSIHIEPGQLMVVQ
jgi:hypothetical protein